jgi:YD repeat-containing protein
LSLKSPEIYFKASCGLDISALLHYGLPPCPKAPVTPFNFEKLFQFELNQAIGYNPLSSMADDIDIVVEAPGIPLSFSRYFSSSLKNRHQNSPLGKGWTHSWQTHLEEDENGNVTIFDLNSSLKYQPDSRGGYFSPKGDYSKLSKADGLFTLKYSDGTIDKFRADGKLDYIEDLNGNRITAESTGNLLTRLSHNAGQFLQQWHPYRNDYRSHRNTLFSYNAEQLASVTDIFGRTTHYFGSRASKHALQTVQYPDNTHEDFSYDANGRLTQIAYNNEPLISFSYDSAGTVTVTSNGSVQTFFYGASGELMKYKDPLGNISEFNSDYQITKIIRPDGLSTAIGYDRAGNANSLKDALGQITAFDYGDFDRMTAVTDAKIHTSDYSYDEKGNLESITYPDSTQEHYLYDAKGNISQSTNRRGTPITYTYDANGLVLRKEYADGTSVAYTYNAIGDLTSVTDQTGITSFTYYSNHGLKRITYPGGRFLEFSYDSAGRRISSVDQLGYTLNYAYDDKGQLSSIQGLVRYSYDEKQRLVRKELGNGVYTTYKYDLADNLIQLINYSSENAILSRFDYSYNSLGNRISMSTLDGDWTYTYDVTGQLTKAQFVSSNASIPNKSISYVYDAVGNRVQEIEDSVTIAPMR